MELFKPEMRAYWEGLKVTPLDKHCLLSDLATLDFAKKQVEDAENCC